MILPERACGARAPAAPAPVLLELEEGNLADIDKARAAGAAGIIAGTALGRIIEANLGNAQAMESAASDYVRAMKAACRPMTVRYAQNKKKKMKPRRSSPKSDERLASKEALLFAGQREPA